MSAKLLPCPFCGCEASVNEIDGAWIAGCDAGQTRATDDMTCRANAIGFYHRTREGAVAAWNRRSVGIEWEEKSSHFWCAKLANTTVGFVTRAVSFPSLGEWEAATTAPYATSSVKTRHKTPDDARAAVATRISEGFAAVLAK